MREFIAFFGLGGVSTAVDYLIYILLILFGFDYVVAIVIGYSAGFWVNYEAGRRFVFTKGRKTATRHSEFIRVFIIAFIGLLLNILIVNLLSITLLSLSYEFSRVIAIGTVFVYNYIARKIFVYH